MHQERTHHRRWHNREQSHEASRKDMERRNKTRKEKQQAHEKMLEGLHQKLSDAVGLTEDAMGVSIIAGSALETASYFAKMSAISASQRCGICEVINERSKNPHSCTAEILPIVFIYDALMKIVQLQDKSKSNSMSAIRKYAKLDGGA